MTTPVGRDRWDSGLNDPAVPLVVLDLASVETYLLVQPLGWLARQSEGALWCPLASAPAPLDLDTDAAGRCAQRARLPLNLPERHPAPVPRAMRVAMLASQRGRAASFMFRMSRLAFGSALDVDQITGSVEWENVDPDHPEQYLVAVEDEMDLDPDEAMIAAEAGSSCDRELQAIAAELQRIGITSAPALRWDRDIHLGATAITRVLPQSESIQPTLGLSEAATESYICPT
jgi:2-hydroxychromene-2-carboxylate isomerase